MSNRPPDAKLTINDIARLAAVSKRTVSRVLNRSPLTSVLLPVRDMGRIAAQKLIALVQDGPDPETEPYTLTPSLVVRQSTAPS